MSMELTVAQLIEPAPPAIEPPNPMLPVIGTAAAFDGTAAHASAKNRTTKLRFISSLRNNRVPRTSAKAPLRDRRKRCLRLRQQCHVRFLLDEMSSNY